MIVTHVKPSSKFRFVSVLQTKYHLNTIPCNPVRSPDLINQNEKEHLSNNNFRLIKLDLRPRTGVHATVT